MARLNEPPAAPAVPAISATGESADASPVIEKAPANFDQVRRRFVRQNRELAKNNSSQSLRIRSLELEVSRLLADNLELRNQVLRVQNDLDTATRRAGGRLKAELRRKIEALMGIVDGMEDEHDSASHVTEKKPLEGNWRERQPLSELMRDSQMPTIQEDKQYPRRTLGAHDTQAMRLSDHSSNESPDLGPPPIAHFDPDNAGDPVKQASPLSNKAALPEPDTAAEGDEELPASLSVNLETRRKRKDGQLRIEARRRSLMPPPSPEKETEQPSAILRTGAKRKLADRDAEKPIRPPSKGDFTFSRKSNGEEAKPSSAVDEASSRPSSPDRPARKVLGDKSVNSSPRKTATTTLSEKPEKDRPIKKAAASRFQTGRKENSRTEDAASRRRRVSALPQPSPKEEVQILETVEIAPPAEPALDFHPKTPAGLDLFSPTPSEPSARLEGRSGTPPPGDLSTLSIATDGGTRPSRRARAAVNYAEPSLNAKMRRPSKQMVDAITGLQHHSRVMSSSVARQSGSRPGIKAELVADEDAERRWKDLPPAHLSPLRDEGGELVAPQAVEEPAVTPAHISSLLLSSRRSRPSIPRGPSAPDDLEAAVRKMEDLDIYDFTESSSPLTESSDAKTGGKDGRLSKVAGTARSHRRHSSVPLGIDAPSFETSTGEAPGSGENAERALKGSVRTASRRRSMML